jgi:predicted enzyme related to lactoylglutathione lyase
MSRVVHFEIHAENPARASQFYTTVFGWIIQKWGNLDYWLVTTGTPDQPGINGGMFPRQGAAPIEPNPISAFVCSIDVDNIDVAMGRVITAGGTVVVPKRALPGVGWSAYCKDTEGNIFGLSQTDPQAR